MVVWSAWETCPAATSTSRAFGVSSDASVVIGYGSSALSWESYEGATEAFRWTNDGGMVGLGDLPGGYFDSVECAVSSDGQVIVGKGSSTASFASFEGATEAFLWTNDGGMVGLGDLLGGHFWSVANAVSSDGKVVVGGGHAEVDWEAFVWDSVNGMRSLKDVLVNQCGLELTGCSLRNAYGISADGLTIVGIGDNPNGDTEAWIVTIPEPTTLALLSWRPIPAKKKIIPSMIESRPPRIYNCSMRLLSDLFRFALLEFCTDFCLFDSLFAVRASVRSTVSIQFKLLNRRIGVFFQLGI